MNSQSAETAATEWQNGTAAMEERIGLYGWKLGISDMNDVMVKGKNGNGKNHHGKNDHGKNGNGKLGNR